MTEFLRAFYERAQAPADDKAPVVFTASTEGRKSDGVDLRMEDWALDRFMQHPVILYAHDYMGTNMPIGTGEPYFEDRKLMMRVNFDADDEFAMRVRGKTVKGMMGGSVGWENVKSDDGGMKHELLEFSIVPVPLDKNALPMSGSRALELATEYANLELDEAVPVTDAVLWERVAAAMAALMHPECSVPDADRKRLYVCLERAYGVCGRTAPEFRSLDELRALGDAEMRALFLEGEWDNPQVRVGAVLNSRNREALTQAQALIQTVLDSAKKEQEKSDEADDEGRALAEMLGRLEKIGEK